MKNSLLFVCCVLAASQAVAKTELRSTTSSLPIVYPHFTLDPNTQSGSPANPANSRLIACTRMMYAGGVLLAQDSTTYKYGFGRGGQLDADLGDQYVPFDESVIYQFDQVAQQFIPVKRRLQDYSSIGEVLAYTIQNWKGASGIWDNYMRWVYAYVAPKKVGNTDFELWYGSIGWAQHVYYENVYNAGGQLISMNSNVYRLDFTYNQNGFLDQQTEQIRDPFNAPFSNTRRTSSTYIGNTPRVSSETIEAWNGTNWENATQSVNVYVGNAVSEVLMATWDNGNWTPSGKIQYVYDASGNPLETIHLVWQNGQFEPSKKELRLFNQFNQPLRYQTFSWDNGENAWTSKDSDVVYRMYYEFFNPASVASQSSGIACSVYPIPANETATVQLTFQEPQEATVLLLDLQGKLIAEAKTERTRNRNIQLPTANIPAGTYLVQVNGVRDRAVKTIQILH